MKNRVPDDSLLRRMYSLTQDTHPERLYVLNKIGIDKKNLVIYDLGCGWNKTLEEAIGVDISPVTNITTSIDYLPNVQDDSVDILISRHSLEYVLDSVKTLQEWYRILKVGGKIIIVSSDFEYLDTMHVSLGGGMHLHAFTRESLKNLISLMSDFELVELETVVEGWSFGCVIVKKECGKIKKVEKKENVYNSHNNLITGWTSSEELYWLNDHARTMENVCEIGSWMGRSTHALLSGCNGIVHSVDHFKGSADPIETSNRDVFPFFLQNVGYFKNLIIHKKNSLEGSKDFEDDSLDMVFIDGGHQYHEVVEDINAWKPKARKILCGHDYQSSAVAKAVMDVLGKTEIFKTIWFLNLINPLYRIQHKIEGNINFSFVKLGDGELLAMLGAQGCNCDGQKYGPKLSESLKSAYKIMGKISDIQITKWKLGMENEIKSLEKELGIQCEADHDLLLNRENELSIYHYNFWRSIKKSKRKKVFVGPERLSGVVSFLNIDEFVEVPIRNSFEFIPRIGVEKDAIYLFSAGMAAKVWIADLLKKCEEITCLDCGSAFDPIFVGRTRTNQLSQEVLKEFYKELL